MNEEYLILEILEKLDQQSRNILGLYFYEKLNIDIIAELLDLEPHVVGNELQKIKNMIVSTVQKNQSKPSDVRHTDVLKQTGVGM